MNNSREDILKMCMSSDIMNKWHWFRYHFGLYGINHEHPLCYSLTETLTAISNVIPDIHKGYIAKIASFSGREKCTDDYDQIIQVLAELIVIRQIITMKSNDEIHYEYEPTKGKSKKNPELTLKTSEYEVGIEVKCPKILSYKQARQQSFQLPSRNDLMINLDFIKTAKEANRLTFPKDNVIKDFLYSANDKFKEFKAANKEFVGVLVIVWDEFVYEPISALLNDFSGIFTDNSYIINDGVIERFINIDYVIITSHIDQIFRVAGDKPILTNAKHMLEYGDVSYPHKIVIKNPISTLDLPKDIKNILHVIKPDKILGAEYQPTDFIQWL